jgi:hypothetical protein
MIARKNGKKTGLATFSNEPKRKTTINTKEVVATLFPFMASLSWDYYIPNALEFQEITHKSPFDEGYPPLR